MKKLKSLDGQGFQMRRFSLVWKGLAGVLIQAVFIREILSVFSGDEFSISIVLSLWLFGGGCGSFFFRKVKKNFYLLFLIFSIVQIFISLVALIFIREAKSFLGVLPGQFLPFGKFFLLCFSSSFIVGFLEGGRFILCCNFYREGETGGKYYFLEGFGALAGGILFPVFLLFNFSPFLILFIAGFINLLSIYTYEKRKIIYGALIFYLFLSFFSLPCEKKSLTFQYLPFKHLETFYTIYEKISLVKREKEIILLSDGFPEITNQPDIYSIRNTVFFSLSFQKNPVKIFVLGLPEILPEIELYKVERIVYIDQNPIKINLIKKYFIPSLKKTSFVSEDPYKFLKENKEKFDVIIMGYPFPLSLRANRFFTYEFALLLKKNLKEKGVFSLIVNESPDYVGRELSFVLSSIIKTFSQVFNKKKFIVDYPVAFLFSVKNNFKKIYTEKTPHKTLFNKFYISVIMNKGKEKNLVRNLFSLKTLLNFNLSPSTIFYSFSFWFSKFSQKVGEIILNFYNKIFFLRNFKYLFFLFLSLLFYLLTSISPYSTISFTNGMVSLSFEIFLLFVFQIIFGYLYFWISLLVGFFMAGASFGGYLSERKKGNEFTLVHSEIFHTLFYLSSLILIFVKSLFVFPFFLFISGFFVGWEFGIITYIGEKQKLIEKTGKIYSLDLFGALTGCFIPFLFLPLFGIKNSLLLLFIIKFANFSSFKISVGKLR